MEGLNFPHFHRLHRLRVTSIAIVIVIGVPQVKRKRKDEKKREKENKENGGYEEENEERAHIGYHRDIDSSAQTGALFRRFIHWPIQHKWPIHSFRSHLLKSLSHPNTAIYTDSLVD